MNVEWNYMLPSPIHAVCIRTPGPYVSLWQVLASPNHSKATGNRWGRSGRLIRSWADTTKQGLLVDLHFWIKSCNQIFASYFLMKDYIYVSQICMSVCAASTLSIRMYHHFFTVYVANVALLLNQILPILVSPACGVMWTSLKAYPSNRWSISAKHVKGTYSVQVNSAAYSLLNG